MTDQITITREPVFNGTGAFYCEECGHTVDTANMAANHENQKHAGAQTMWTAREREEATEIRDRTRERKYRGYNI